jgi:multiple sugar transport system permease protein
MLLMLLFYVLPALWAIRTSFTDLALAGPKALDSSFVGLKQYRRLFTDSDFYHAFGRSLLYAAGTIIGQFAIGMTAALLLSGRYLKGRNVLLATLVLPMVIPGVMQALIWQSMLAVGEFGTLNRIIGILGLGPYKWTFEFPMFSILFVNFWNNSGFAMILFLAGLENIAKEILESSEMDGANGWQQLLYVKLPLIRYVILLWLLINTLGCLNVFDLVYALTRGGPGNATEIMGLYIYNQGFRHYELGFGSAAAAVLMVVSLGIAISYVRALRVKL